MDTHILTPDLMAKSKLTKLTAGNVNDNYCLEYSDKRYHLKVRKSKTYPSIQKLTYINRKLIERNINVPKIIGSSEGDECFKEGYIISQWIDGRSFSDLREYCETIPYWMAEIGKVHQIQSDYFDNQSFTRKSDSFSLFMMGEISDLLLQLRQNGKVTESDASGIYSRARFLSESIAPNKIHPVLIHKDCTKSNILMTDNGAILVDWDNSEFNCKVVEFSRITFNYLDQFSLDMFARFMGSDLSSETTKKIEMLEHTRCSLEGLLHHLNVSTDSKYRKILEI